MRPGPSVVAAFVLSLEREGIAVVERVAREMRSGRTLSNAKELPGILEVALLSTCHRVEVYAVAKCPEDLSQLQRLLPGPPNGWTFYHDGDAVVHLYRVASGLESLAVGEREVRHQVDGAASAIWSRAPHALLRDLLRGASSLADRLLPPEGSAPSIAAVAAQLVEERTADGHPRVAVIGTGTVGRRIAVLLSGRADLTLVYHRRAPEPAFLARARARAAPLSELGRVLAHADVVVAATKGRELPLDAGRFPKERSGPRLWVDLGMPRNLDPRLGRRKGVDLWDLERMRRELAPGLPPAGLEESVEEGARKAMRRFHRHALEPLIAELWRRGEEVRREEVLEALSHLPHAGPNEREVLEKLSERLVRRLIAGPTRRLRDLPPEESEEMLRVALALPRAP